MCVWLLRGGWRSLQGEEELCVCVCVCVAVERRLEELAR